MRTRYAKHVQVDRSVYVCIYIYIYIYIYTQVPEVERVQKYCTQVKVPLHY